MVVTAKMEVGVQKRNRNQSSKAPTRIYTLDRDILCTIFAFLGLFDLVHCSVVCKTWSVIINKSKLLRAFYLKINGIAEFSECSEKKLGVFLEELAMESHRLALKEGFVDVRQWRGHSLRVNQCRMKMGKLLTGVGDKVMRFWSLENYKCVEEYPMPDSSSLVDFDFDESKNIDCWIAWEPNRNMEAKRGKKRISIPRGYIPKGLMYAAVVGCEDGTARIFDMYSRKCSRIIRMHNGPVKCLCLSDDQLIIGGSSMDSVSISSLLSVQHVAKLRSRDFTDLQALCFNPRNHLVFAGSTSGRVTCWDIRTSRVLWEKRVSPNVVYSLQHMKDDRSTLVAGGIDGVLRLLDQNTGEIVSSVVSEPIVSSSRSRGKSGFVERMKGKRVSEDANIDRIFRGDRPPITCLAVGMKKVVTTHNSKHIRVLRFGRVIG